MSQVFSTAELLTMFLTFGAAALSQQDTFYFLSRLFFLKIDFFFKLTGQKHRRKSYENEARGSGEVIEVKETLIYRMISWIKG